MNIPESVAAFGVPLLTLIMALLAVVYRNDRESSKTTTTQYDTRITALERQNTEQEARIATLVANQAATLRDGDRLLSALDKLDRTQNAILQELGHQRVVITELSRRIGGSGGYPTPPRAT